MKPIEVAIAILYRGDRVFLQLRDDIPTIIHPGLWGFFGGHLEPGESPQVALERELAEEIGFRPLQADYFRLQASERVKRHVFAVPFTADLEMLSLQEGQDWGWAEAKDIAAGSVYSERLQERRPIAPPHRALLAEFFRQSLQPIKLN